MTAFNTVRSLKRGLEVLRALNRCDGAKAQALARIVGLPRPTVYRLLETLETLGYVARSPSDEAWHLTLQVKALSAGFHDETWVVRTAAPVLEALGREVLWPVDLVTFDRDAMAIRESTHGSSPFSIDRGMVGTRLPILETSSGRAYLAFCPEAEREAILERLCTAAGTADAAAGDRAYTDRLLAETRRAGFGSRTEGFNPHTASISVPVFWGGRVQACITLIWIASALRLAEAVSRYLTPVRRASNEIEARLRETESAVPGQPPSLHSG